MIVFFWVEVGGWFVDNNQLWIIQQGLGDVEMLVYVVGIVGNGFVGVLGQIGLFQQCFDYIFVFFGIGQVFEYSQMVQYGVC